MQPKKEELCINDDYKYTSFSKQTKLSGLKGLWYRVEIIKITLYMYIYIYFFFQCSVY